MSTLSKTVILTAPQGWGKTRNATALQTEHGCIKVVDNWAAHQPVIRGALHLTNTNPTELDKAAMGLGAIIVSRGW